MARRKGSKYSPRPKVEGATFRGLLVELAPGQWRATSLLQLPQMFADEENAREWLRSDAATLGFDKCDITVESLAGQEGNAPIVSRVNASARKLYADIKLGAHRVFDGWPPLF